MLSLISLYCTGSGRLAQQKWGLSNVWCVYLKWDSLTHGWVLWLKQLPHCPSQHSTVNSPKMIFLSGNNPENKSVAVLALFCGTKMERFHVMFQGQFPAITPITLFLGLKSSSLAIWQDPKKCCLHAIACYLSREASKTSAPTPLRSPLQLMLFGNTWRFPWASFQNTKAAELVSQMSLSILVSYSKVMTLHRHSIL